MKILGALAIAVLAIGGTARLQAGIVYLDDSSGNLYDGDPTTGVFNLIGNSGVVFEDIDFTSNGNLYGEDGNGNLYQINTATAAVNLIGPSGVGFVGAGLVGDSSGNLYAGGSGNIYSINTATGAATPIGANQGYTISGDLEFVGSTMYGTSISPSSGNGGELWQIDPTTGNGTDIGPTNFSSVWGLAYDTDNGVFYGYDAVGDEFSINTATGAGTALFSPITGTLINGTTDYLFGAAFESTPEPATLILVGLPLAMLGFARRRKSGK